MNACCFDETVKLLKQICVYVYVRDYLKGGSVWCVCVRMHAHVRVGGVRERKRAYVCACECACMDVCACVYVPFTNNMITSLQVPIKTDWGKVSQKNGRRTHIQGRNLMNIQVLKVFTHQDSEQLLPFCPGEAQRGKGSQASQLQDAGSWQSAVTPAQTLCIWARRIKKEWLQGPLTEVRTEALEFSEMSQGHSSTVTERDSFRYVVEKRPVSSVISLGLP